MAFLIAGGLSVARSEFEWNGRTARRWKGIAAAGPWRVVTDPLSEQRRLPPCGDLWTIIDACDQVVFTGTKKDCEDWLDYQDNIA